MKRLLVILFVLMYATAAHAGQWTAYCTFAATVCVMDLGAVGQTAGNGTATLFTTASGGDNVATLTLSLSPDGVTYYTAYTENGDTAVDTFPNDNAANKALTLGTVWGARYWKFTSNEANVNTKTLILQGRD